jgi:hypothetical protein
MELVLLQKKIFEIRGQRVMLDFHLSELYGVETRVLKQAVKRNLERFPSDFMFVLNDKEVGGLVSQIVIPSKSYLGGSLPFAFTEHGITMLSSILKSKTAININIAVVRAFILLKQYNNNFGGLQKRIDELEAKFNRKIENINEVIEFLLSKPEEEKTKLPDRKPIGFKIPKKEK